MTARSTTSANSQPPASPKFSNRPQSAGMSRVASKLVEQIQNATSSDSLRKKLDTLQGEDITFDSYPGAIADHAPVFVRKVGASRLNRPQSAGVSRREVAEQLHRQEKPSIVDDSAVKTSKTSNKKSSTPLHEPVKKFRDGYVPDHLKDVNYKMDIYELLKDKFDQHSGTFHSTFRRLTKSAGYSGFTIDREMFKQALVKDFHLFEDDMNSSADHEEIRKYQNQQKDKLESFIDRADVNKDGYIRYNDFLRVISELDRSANQHTTQSQRHSRYSSTMVDPEKRKQDKLKEKEMKKQTTDPPYALYNEAEKYELYFVRKHQERLHKLRTIFCHLGLDPNATQVPLDIFRKGVQKFDRYIVDREIEEIIDVLGARKNGWVDLDDFMDKFALDVLKPKTFRGSYETLHVLEWPQTLEETVSRADRIKSMREKSEKHLMKGNISNTRYNVMRADKIKRELISDEYRRQMTAIGYLSPKQRKHVETFLYDHDDHLKDGRLNRMEPILSPKFKRLGNSAIVERSKKIDTHKYHKPKFIRNPDYLLSSNGAVSLRRSTHF
jgi:Ca2+-binding EF-hand superfamily protein